MMTTDEKELLLKDLCARLPYGVKMDHIADDEYSSNTLIGIAKDMITLEGLGGYECVNVEHYKPYLFPLSSMTEEQRNEYHELLYNPKHGIDIDYFDWCHKNHLDCRGLIPKYLAINATGLNIY